MGHNPAVKFITALQDLNQPYSCAQWGNAGANGIPVIVEHDGTIFNWLHDPWSAFPTYALIDHTMTVRAKPWSYQSNGNNNSCDGSNGSVSGWNGGNTNDFLQQLADECGALCEGGGCTNAAGDVNSDDIVNIQDIITLVNHILSVTVLEGCNLEAADLNQDGVTNIQDLISVVNVILGTGRVAPLNGKAKAELLTHGNDLVIKLNASVDIAGVELSIPAGTQLDFLLKDNSHISQESSYVSGVNRYIAYSLFNKPFDSKNAEILLLNGKGIDSDAIQMTIADRNGDVVVVNSTPETNNYHSGPFAFELAELFPNPFNPSTEIQFSVPRDEFVRLSAFDVRGKEVDLIFEGMQSAGMHHYNWNAGNLPSGVYYVRLQAGSEIETQKALLVK